MKHIFSLFLLSLSTTAFSQSITGEVRDQTNRSAINLVQVIHQKKTVLSNFNGEFELADVKVGDRIGFRAMGYETKEVEITKENFSSPILILLKSKPVELQAVNIRAPRLHQRDSLMLRKEYEAIFNYKAPKFTGMFVKINPEAKYPLALVKPPSTSSIFTFNALQALSLFGKDKKRMSKLKTTLLTAEGNNYINSRFSETKVKAITALQGDSLTNFLDRFKPTVDQLRKMNDYQLSIYIKSKHSEFVREK